MKQLFSNSALRVLLLLAALFQFTTISAYDFEVDGILYRITSSNTVSVNGNNLIDDGLIDNLFYPIIIEIPNQITYNHVDYTVTAIDDNAFYYNNRFYSEYTSIGLILDISLPETITSIGSNAFGGEGFDLINIICFANTPPEINGNINSHSVVNLFVNEDAYSLYDETNNQNQLFSSIRITNGERSAIPSGEVEYLQYPDDLSQFNDSWIICRYGFTIHFDKKEKCDIITRMFGLSRLGIEFDVQGWTNSNNICFEHSGPDPSSYISDIIIQSYIIEEGKSPNYSDYAVEEGFYTKFELSFDFKESNVAYIIINNNEIKVTYCIYNDESMWDEAQMSIIPHYGFYNNGIYYIFYSGDIIIPSTATQHIYYDDTYASYPVTTIGRCAFSLKDIELDEDNITIDGLTSVTMPASITSVEEYAFGDCPNLAFIKCKGAVPPSAYDNSFDDGVYQNTTLYVPRDAVEAYRNATGWKNFQNIVGHYDFDYDFEVDGVYYAIVGDDVVVAHGDNAYQGVINIPAEVTYEGVTYDVAGISDGAFADATVQHLVLPVTIGTIGEGAFAGCHIGSLVITGNGAWNAGAINCEVDNLYVMSGVTGIAGLQVNPAANVYSYSTVPPTCDSGSFTGYDAALHVPASALAAYFTAPYWNYFINITSDAVEPTGLTINNDNVAVLVGNQLTLNATPAPANATPGDAILWTSSNDSIATVDGGVITAVKVGECDIKAVLLDKTAVCHVTVTEIAPTSLTVSPDFAKLETGSQITLTATVLPGEATDKVVTWSSSNTAVATVNNEGIVTAVAPGECDVTATCRGIQATCHIIVVDHFIYITLDEHNVRLLPNHMLTLTPSVIPEGTSLVVTSTNPDIAAARMANGKIQVVGIKEGTTIVKVNSTDGYAEADSCIVKVYTMRGDVNCDGFVNIGDVTSLINYLLSHNANGIDVVNADANNDGNVNISDVTRLINHILSGDELDPKDETEEDGLTFTVNGVTFTMVAVEGGTFTMGATAEQGDDALDAERPTHQVTLSGYAIGQTEVTQALWEAVTGNNPSRFAGRPDCPVEGVSWDECQAFITQLNALTGKQFRLPTEAEWEFAARGGNKSQHYKYAGSDDLDEVAWFHDNAYGIGDNGTRDVGTKKANELGIYDMSGNVWEWCQDIYDNYGSQPQTNPTGPESGTNRMRRGGAWDQGTVSCRVSHRSNRAPNYKYNNLGLRLAL